MYEEQLRSLSDSPFPARSSSLFWVCYKGSSLVVFPWHPDQSSILATSHNKVESPPDSNVKFLESRRSKFVCSCTLRVQIVLQSISVSSLFSSCMVSGLITSHLNMPLLFNSSLPLILLFPFAWDTFCLTNFHSCFKVQLKYHLLCQTSERLIAHCSSLSTSRDFSVL